MTLNARAGEPLGIVLGASRLTNWSHAVTFIGLNAVRFLSIVSLILVFSSTIFVMVNNVKAVNAFEANKGNVDMENCDYIECVVSLSTLSYFGDV
jgi:hypothetical protein